MAKKYLRMLPLFLALCIFPACTNPNGLHSSDVSEGSFSHNKTTAATDTSINATPTFTQSPASSSAPATTVTSAPSKLAINQSSLTVDLEETAPLTANKTNVTWKSANPAVATVDANGLVRGKTFGSTVITASAEGQKVECRVTVDYLGPATKTQRSSTAEHGDQQGEWLYFSNPADQFKLYKYRRRDNLLIKLGDMPALDKVVVVGKWLYYIYRESNPEVLIDWQLYRMAIDGSQNAKFLDDSVVSVKYIDGWLYCTKDSFNGMRMRPDGSERFDYSLNSSSLREVEGQAYYYTVKKGSATTLCFGPFNNPAVEICQISSYIGIYQNWIYYTSYDDGNYMVCRVPKNGIGPRKDLFLIPDGWPALKNGYLYFEEKTGSYPTRVDICRISLDSMEKEFVMDCPGRNWWIIGDFIIAQDTIESMIYSLDGSLCYNLWFNRAS